MVLQRRQFVTAVLAGVIFGGALGIGASFGAVPSGPRRDTRPMVTVKASFLNPESTEDARFDIALDTHSVDLDGYELKRLSLLRDGAGNTYEPIRVENKGSGHHRDVVLIFPRPAGGVKSLELVIKNIAGVKERLFRWNL